METWKHEILNSLKGIKKAEPPKYIFGEIQQKIIIKPRIHQIIIWKRIAFITSLLIILFINTFIILNYSTQSNDFTKKAYNNMIINYNLYEENNY
ncbi:hypothetical protein [Chondrinema litorale]|uniref:hypothetical protein n=1 Tax=Chondrinema litorale TaxID=2994555 RepID=UPI002543AE8E|nr:hypothetical protein [Chondrinema litorale]UZR98963.1 hypothetical protein OQ292_34500 [Chondrinema litorale]